MKKMIREYSRSKQKNVSMAWIKKKEAFDTEPFEDILKVLII